MASIKLIGTSLEFAGKSIKFEVYVLFVASRSKLNRKSKISKRKHTPGPNLVPREAAKLGRPPLLIEARLVHLLMCSKSVQPAAQVVLKSSPKQDDTTHR